MKPLDKIDREKIRKENAVGMKPVFKCPHCGNTDRFTADVLATLSFKGRDFYTYKSPQVKPDFYIRCGRCEGEGEVSDFCLQELYGEGDGFLDDLFKEG